MGEIDESAVIRTFLQELGGGGGARRIMSDIWQQASTLKVRRAAPRATRAGRVLPFHLAIRNTGAHEISGIVGILSLTTVAQCPQPETGAVKIVFSDPVCTGYFLGSVQQTNRGTAPRWRNQHKPPVFP